MLLALSPLLIRLSTICPLNYNILTPNVLARFLTDFTVSWYSDNYQLHWLCFHGFLNHNKISLTLSLESLHLHHFPQFQRKFLVALCDWQVLSSGEENTTVNQNWFPAQFSISFPLTFHTTRGSHYCNLLMFLNISDTILIYLPTLSFLINKIRLSIID